MLCGLGFTAAYIYYFKFMHPEAGPADWWFGISPEGIGSLGMVINFGVTLVITAVTAPPPASVQEQVEHLRYPSED